MEVNEAIKSRRCVRKYKPDKVSMHLVAKILDAARFAPSAGNTQNWWFVIVTDIEQKKRIAEASANQLWMTTAPLYIVICNDYKRLVELYGASGKMFSIQDCAVIATYIMLLAKENNLDTCWVGSFDPEKVQKILKLPEYIDPEIILTIGYSDELKVKDAVRNEIEDMTFFNAWGDKEHTEPKPKLKDKLKSLKSLVKR